MKRVELLAPAGSFEALRAAVASGCDAVYLGGNMFGARAFAQNFDREEMQQAIAYAHGFGVKLYVTMNTLIMEDEMEAALEYAKFLYEANVDALIIQDLGLFDACHQLYPDLELHASTQMHIHNEQGIQMMEKAGAKRVVVPRECSVEQIEKLASLNVDLEVFVQGALCVSYSGQCLMSAKELSRSGNRGECAQMCRMRYRLGKVSDGKESYLKSDGEYLLSPKDLNTLIHVPKLIEAGIASFKIEGRMKRPAYVALMVSLYRKAIDAYYAKERFEMGDAQEQMRLIFNRDFTLGHLFQQRGSALMNPYRPNHMGVRIGKVSMATKERMQILLEQDLHQGDGIRILQTKEDQGCMVNKLYHKGYLVNAAAKGDLVEIEYHGFVEKNAVVVKTSDKQQLERLQETYEQNSRKIGVHMEITMEIGRVAVLKVYDEEGFEVVKSSELLVEKAMKTPLDEERLKKQLRKCGDTIFQVLDIQVRQSEQSTISIKEINQLRRFALEELTNLRQQRSTPKRYGTYTRTCTSKQELQRCVVVRTMDQYLMAKFYPNVALYAADRLYDELTKQGITIGFYGPRVNPSTYPKTKVIFSENSGIVTGGIADHFVNVTNSYAAAFLFSNGCIGITFSTETNARMHQNITEAFQQRYGCTGNFFVYAYGHEEYMVSEYCPINMCTKDNGKKECGACKGKDTYFLEDAQAKRYPLWGDQDCRMHILSPEPYRYMEDQRYYGTIFSFYRESPQQLKQILDSQT